MAEAPTPTSHEAKPTPHRLRTFFGLQLRRWTPEAHRGGQRPRVKLILERSVAAERHRAAASRVATLPGVATHAVQGEHPHAPLKEDGLEELGIEATGGSSYFPEESALLGHDEEEEVGDWAGGDWDDDYYDEDVEEDGAGEKLEDPRYKLEMVFDKDGEEEEDLEACLAAAGDAGAWDVHHHVREAVGGVGGSPAGGHPSWRARKGRGAGGERNHATCWMVADQIVLPTGRHEVPPPEPAIKVQAQELDLLRPQDYMLAVAADAEARRAFQARQEAKEASNGAGKSEGTGKGGGGAVKWNLRLSSRNLYGCPFCGYRHIKQSWLAHLKRDHKDKGLIFCRNSFMCNMPFQSEEMMQRHIDKALCNSSKVASRGDVTNDRHCHLCQQDFDTSDLLKQHMAAHRDPKDVEAGVLKYVCHHCGKHLGTSSQHTQHIIMKHRPEFMRFVCSWEGCGMRFMYERLLVQHELAHRGEKGFFCSYCGLGLTSKYSLKAHEDRHERGEFAHQMDPSELRRLPCEVCGKSIRETTMKYHLMRHQGLAPDGTKLEDLPKFTCNVCGKTFVGKSQFKRHQDIHEGNKKHACQYCGKAFVQKSNMLEHERIHTGEKPYACSWCPEKFIQGTRRKKHEETCRFRSADDFAS